jgi:hypothetical protein
MWLEKARIISHSWQVSVWRGPAVEGGFEQAAAAQVFISHGGVAFSAQGG